MLVSKSGNQLDWKHLSFKMTKLKPNGIPCWGKQREEPFWILWRKFGMQEDSTIKVCRPSLSAFVFLRALWQPFRICLLSFSPLFFFSVCFPAFYISSGQHSRRITLISPFLTFLPFHTNIAEIPTTICNHEIKRPSKVFFNDPSRAQNSKLSSLRTSFETTPRCSIFISYFFFQKFLFIKFDLQMGQMSGDKTFAETGLTCIQKTGTI